MYLIKTFFSIKHFIPMYTVCILVRNEMKVTHNLFSLAMWERGNYLSGLV